MPITAVTFENATVIRRADAGTWYRVQGREMFVGAGIALPGTETPRNGECGRLVVPRWFAQASGLAEPGPR